MPIGDFHMAQPYHKGSPRIGAASGSGGNFRVSTSLNADLGNRRTRIPFCRLHGDSIDTERMRVAVSRHGRRLARYTVNTQI